LSLSDADDETSDIDELIYCFASAYLHIFPASVRCLWLHIDTNDITGPKSCSDNHPMQWKFIWGTLCNIWLAVKLQLIKTNFL